ncbi:C6 zinc finger domain-containing protein [Colletotrichum karsti]|uniref:C6 zinc finger domain-containing protein n=1 Tax=Colletotrichum karsti TaxID=1095194 RepID=A0A9P6LES5_9PEZI|nr:C6 zinc finger domain-containing protein [Colletotrichum karsti]KAF9870733.1 C6 zinc finger domain-containing protein [Colletotrichum karsti]
MKEYLEAASLVTSNDQLLNSLEGLECLLLEAAYHTNAGDLRRAWLVIKRAVAHAQLIGLHRGHPANPVVLDPETQTSPSIMWHRIVSEDRYLALMLGLPPDTSARAVPANMSLAAGECPSEYLERIHAQAMGLIAARNVEDDASGDILATQEIDQMLQQAARSMPDNWWLLPTAKRRSESSNIGNVESLENVLRILLQITHFNLLVLLHLPQMLRRVSVHSQSYSKDACVNASRELLGRYVKFRCMNQISFCCTGIDFAAFTAYFLGHQRLSDRATIEEVVDLMLEVNGSSCDELLAQTAFILRSFLDIEGDAAADVTASAGQTVNNSARPILGHNIQYLPA